MAQLRPSLVALYNQAISDVLASKIPGIGNGLIPDSVFQILSYNNALMANGQYGYIDYCLSQCTPFTATDEYLLAWAKLKGITPKLATPATGVATATGTAGADIPQGTVLLRSDNIQYQTVEDVVVSISGSVVVPFKAISPGAGSNLSLVPYGGSVVLTPQSPVPGVYYAFIVTTDIINGSDDESTDSFRTRMLAAYAAPSQGGSASDYLGWLKAVPGVSRAWVSFTNEPTIGCAYCYVMFDDANAITGGFPNGTNGVATLEGRWPVVATGDQLTVADYVFLLKPGTDLVFISAPIAQPIAYNFLSITPDTTQNRDAISSALTTLFLNRGTPLGVTISTAVQYAALTSIPTLTDFSFSTPLTDVVTPVGSLPTLGAVNIG